jgi:hypothetical protein
MNGRGRSADRSFSVARRRLDRHFDGNAQGRIQAWLWVEPEALTTEMFDVLASSKDLNWVIVPYRPTL